MNVVIVEGTFASVPRFSLLYVLLMLSEVESQGDSNKNDDSECYKVMVEFC